MDIETSDGTNLAGDGNPHGRIVVGIDGSAESIEALRWAAELADRTFALLDVVAVWDGRGVHGWRLGPDGADRCDAEIEAQKIAEQAVDDVFGPDRPRGLRTFVLAGKPAHTLVEHSAGADLLVLGNCGRGRAVAKGLGSVSYWCTVHACCPVLIVHEKDRLPLG